MESIALSKQQMANLYRICKRTFTNWLIEAGFDHTKRLYTPKDQELMFEKFGIPKDFDKYIDSIKIILLLVNCCIV
jgi:hypothetical protein